MIILTDKHLKEFRKTNIIAWGLLVGAPIAYLVAMFSIDPGLSAEAGNELMFYLLLVIALIQPVVYYPIKKFQIGTFQRNRKTAMSTAQLYFTLSIIKFSLVESSFIYGLVIYFITGSISSALYFYPIGIAWSIVYWPRENKFMQFLEKVGDK